MFSVMFSVEAVMSWYARTLSVRFAAPSAEKKPTMPEAMEPE